MDPGDVFQAMWDAVRAADSAEAAWRAVVGVGIPAGISIREELLSFDAGTEVRKIVAQVRHTMQQEPPLEDLTFLYFGLFTSVSPGAPGGEGAGFYVSGGTGSDPEADVHQRLTYFPDHRFLGSGLLQGIKMEVTCEGGDYEFYDYALMFGAAAVLAKFAVRELGLPYAVVVGFDSGDIVRVA
ncbi:MAG TPA: hypothetical protein VIG47_08010 [Gemmatimonadaceae bacterium]|jgi:hypothetical protein